MSDSPTTLNPGVAGDAVAMDLVGGEKYQWCKLVWGPNDTITKIDDALGKRMPVDIGHDGVFTLQAAQVSAVTNVTTTRTTTTGLGKYADLDILINITGGGAITGTLQLFLQDSADGGTTWDDLVASNTFTFGAAVINQQFTISGRVATTRAQGAAAQQEALAAGSVRQGPWGDRIRVREKVSGVGGSPTGATYTITAIPKR